MKIRSVIGLRTLKIAQILMIGKKLQTILGDVNFPTLINFIKYLKKNNF